MTAVPDPVDLDQAQALADSLDVALSNHPDTDCPPVCEVGSSAADMIRTLVGSLRPAREALTTAQQDALNEAADELEELTSLHVPSTPNVIPVQTWLRARASAIGNQP